MWQQRMNLALYIQWTACWPFFSVQTLLTQMFLTCKCHWLQIGCRHSFYKFYNLFIIWMRILKLGWEQLKCFCSDFQAELKVFIWILECWPMVTSISPLYFYPPSFSQHQDSLNEYIACFLIILIDVFCILSIYTWNF